MQNESHFLNQLKQATARLEITNAEGTVTFTATGYLVAPDLIATCAHTFSEGNPHRVTAKFLGKGKEFVTAGTLVASDTQNDTALIRLDTDHPSAQPLPLGAGPKAGATWTSYGFPSVASGAGILFTGTITDPMARDAQGRPSIILHSPQFASSDSVDGLSGTPVLVNGAVIGHLRRIIPGAANQASFGMVYLTPAQFIQDLLRRVTGETNGVSAVPAKASLSADRPLNIFLSYASKDEEFANQLQAQLSILSRRGILNVWSQNKILPMSDLRAEVKRYIEEADIICPLLSADYLASEELYTDLEAAMNRHRSKSVRVVPILLRPVDWKSSALADLPILPANEQSIDTWVSRDAAYLDVTKGLQRVIASIKSAVAPKAVEAPVVEALPRTSLHLGQLRGAVNDRNYEVDQLGFQTYVNAFADLVESRATSPPLTVGIFGSWGMGKSFLLKGIESELVRRRTERKKKKGQDATRTGAAKDGPVERVHIVTFNAWEYAASKAVWPRLVRRVLDDLESSKAWSTWNRIGLFGRKLRHNLSRLIPRIVSGAIWVGALILIGLVGWLTYRYLAARGYTLDFQRLSRLKQAGAALITVITTGALGSVVKALSDTVSKPLSSQFAALFQKSDYGGLADNMEEIRRDLEGLGRRIDAQKDRIVVMIDDLDRCEPAKSVEVLQAVNLLLNFQYFIVFLGIDARITTRAIEETYKNIFSAAGASGYEYLDKIIQIPFRIPPPRTAEVESFLEKVMRGGLATARKETATASAQGTAAEAATSATQPSSGGATEVPALANTKPPAPTAQAERPAAVSAADESAAAKPAPMAAPPPRPAQDFDAAFSEDEFHAFKDIARYLRPNPRHLKRLINVYRLVRIMAERRFEETQAAQIILQKPAETIAWLAACSQWPYSTQVMLAEYDDLIEDLEEGTLSQLPQEPNPLSHLLDQVKSQIVSERQRKLDHDPDLLRGLLRRRVRLSWDEISQVRQYTINFNPSIETEQRTEPEKPKA
jgi:Cdc6-like AAA superfamily ATPase